MRRCYAWKPSGATDAGISSSLTIATSTPPKTEMRPIIKHFSDTMPAPAPTRAPPARPRRLQLPIDAPERRRLPPLLRRCWY